MKVLRVFVGILGVVWVFFGGLITAWAALTFIWPHVSRDWITLSVLIAATSVAWIGPLILSEWLPERLNDRKVRQQWHERWRKSEFMER